jgi:hypothetical protein
MVPAEIFSIRSRRRQRCREGNRDKKSLAEGTTVQEDAEESERNKLGNGLGLGL